MFSGLAIVSTAEQALAAERLRALMTVAQRAGELAYELQQERVAATLLLLRSASEVVDTYDNQREATDTIAGQYDRATDDLSSLPAPTARILDRVDGQLERLSALRNQVTGRQAASSAVGFAYRIIIADLIALREAVPQAGGAPAQIADRMRAASALSSAAEAVGLQQVAVLRAADRTTITRAAQNEITATRTSYSEAIQDFNALAEPQWVVDLNTSLAAGNVVEAQRLEDAVAGAVPGDALQLDLDGWTQAMAARIEVLHAVEGRVDDEVLNSVTAVRAGELRSAAVQAGVVAVTTAAVLAAAVWLGAPMIRRLRRLRDAARRVAFAELPEVVSRLQHPGALEQATPDQIAAAVAPPDVGKKAKKDEIAEVVEAFGEVHRAAVRTAAEQTALRTSVSAMFLNLARRSQALVDRMISHLDEIERNEEDPKRLSRLFSLDHLATRMRRNDENLLVLAGADSSPPRTDDAPLADILRAAQSEVEHYARIEFGTVDADVSVVALAVNDVVRLVAELFDNATRYSPPGTPVVSEARRLGDQVIIHVEDQGVGMPQDQVAQLNAWLAAPPGLEFTTFRRMGLAVVGRLASRHHIRVELRSDSRIGTIVYVALPPSILVLPHYRLRSGETPLPRTPLTAEGVPSSPPVPARLLGQLPQRSAEVVSHARRRGSRATAALTAESRSNLQTDQPVAGRLPDGLIRTINHLPPAPPRVKPQDSTVEMPIFREMEAVWFRGHGRLDFDQQGGHRPPDSATPPPTTTVPSTAGGGTSAMGSGYLGADQWHTPADAGWSAAAAAAEPAADGATRSGLPKRVPQAQFVPGGVEAGSSDAAPVTQRRSPDEVRGLLSAYHRGVQRGRQHGGG
jgi:signal transduction histidine kinase